MTNKKQSFLLLEVLIALALVIVCVIPIIVKPIEAYRFEMRTFEEMERERLADWTFSEIKEKLYKNEISWGKIPSLKKVAGPFVLNPAKIQVPGLKAKCVERTFSLYCRGEKQGRAGETFRMIYVKIEFRPALTKKQKIYTYRTIVEKSGAEPG